MFKDNMGNEIDISILLAGIKKRFNELNKSIDSENITSFINIRGRNNKKVEEFIEKLQITMEQEMMRIMTENQAKYFKALVKHFFKKHPEIIFMWPEEIKDILKEVLTIR